MSDNPAFPQIQRENSKRSVVIAIYRGNAIVCSIHNGKGNAKRRRRELVEEYGQHAAFYVASLREDRWDEFVRDIDKQRQEAEAARSFQVVSVKRPRILVPQ